MAIRLQDIADDVGVSKVTVSKVLRGSPDVGPATRQKILQRMRELDYQPNYQARALAGGQTGNIGLIVPDLVHPFFAEIAKGLSAVARESGRVLLLGSSEEEPAIERQQISTFQQRGVDALLVASCQQRFQAPVATGKGTQPCILVDRRLQSTRLHYVGSDDHQLGTIATTHLASLGRFRLAHIGSEGTSTGAERLRAFRDVVKARSLTLPDGFVVLRKRFEEQGDRAGYQAMQQLLACEPRPDGVFCYNDLTAVGAMAATLEAGLRIPEDIAFVGCGNFRYADYLRIPLTSVDQGAQAMGQAAGKLALELLASPAGEPRIVLLEPSLVVRASSMARPS